jgi:succinate dehydrogenase flavin-adding protein (antitoxin of CptAB toxin-antitoxin module)
MLEEKQVVNLNEEPAPQIDRTPPTVEEAPQSEPATEVPLNEEQAQIPPVQAVNPDVDEFGVPWKNRAMEWKRKSEEVIEKLPQIIDEKLSKINQPQVPTYTYEQLEAYKLQNLSDANIVSWATGEQRKLQLAENRKLFEEVTGSRERQREADLGRQQAFEAVKQKYPDALNQNSPMYGLVKQYMQMPEFQSRADGLFWAAKMAKADLLENQTPVLQKKVEAQKAEIKQAQKASLTEGSGRRVTTSAPAQHVAMESLRKTGSMRDAESAIGSILRAKGILGE